MLTSELAIAEYDFRTLEVRPDRLRQSTHALYLLLARRALEVYRRGIGKTRRELHRAVERVFDGDPECPQRRAAAFCKLLDEASDFTSDRRGKAAELRMTVFRKAAASHPLIHRQERLLGSDEQAVKERIALELGQPWSEIEAGLYADVIDYHRLLRFHGYADERALLARYNVAQTQAALYQAESLTAEVHEDLKTVIRYVKLARLMHTIERLPKGGWRLRLDGPASLLRSTRRYGVAMARFLPALLACRNWRIHAVIRRGKAPYALRLTSEDGLTSHLPPPEEFDSKVEEKFAQRWGEAPREGWRLERESEILHHGQKVFVPDFVLRHDDGRAVMLEIVGFWTPEYLAAKAQTLRRFANAKILLAVAESSHDKLPELDLKPIIYKTSLKPEAVLERLAKLMSATSNQALSGSPSQLPGMSGVCFKSKAQRNTNLR